MVFGHNGHALIYGMLRTREDNWAGHDLVDLGVSRRMAHEDYFASVVTLRQDTDQSTIENDQQDADTRARPSSQSLHRRCDRELSTDSVLIFALQDASNCVGMSHQTSLPRQSVAGAQIPYRVERAAPGKSCCHFSALQVAGPQLCRHTVPLAVDIHLGRNVILARLTFWRRPPPEIHRAQTSVGLGPRPAGRTGLDCPCCRRAAGDR